MTRRKGARDPDPPSRWVWRNYSAIAYRRPSPRPKRRLRARRWGPGSSPTHPARAWISPDTVALMHGATIGYVWEGGWLPRLDWDLLERGACDLLGYGFEPHARSAAFLYNALQEVALMWPPPATFREALHEVIDCWASNPRIDAVRGHHNVRRLARARNILEGWNGRELG